MSSLYEIPLDTDQEWRGSDASHVCEPFAVACGNVEIKCYFSIPAFPGLLPAAGNCAEYAKSFCVLNCSFD